MKQIFRRVIVRRYVIIVDPIRAVPVDSDKPYLRKICLIDIALRNPAYDHRTCTYYLHAYACHLRCTTTFATCGLFECMAPRLYPFQFFHSLVRLFWTDESLQVWLPPSLSSLWSLNSGYLDHNRMRRNHYYEQPSWQWYHCDIKAR